MPVTVYLSRTVQSISHRLTALETAIRQHFLPALTGQVAFSDDIRKLLALPCRLGGLNIMILCK